MFSPERTSKLPRATVFKLVALAESLVDEPYPNGCRKLVGSDNSYRVRKGDYRLVYQVRNGQLIIEVVLERGLLLTVRLD
ncbi:type II toxin-antitoxin system RelE family toxin [Endozoicomonadaceae bacterium StTr2]